MQLNVSANDKHFSLFHSSVFASFFEDSKTTHRSCTFLNLIFMNHCIYFLQSYSLTFRFDFLNTNFKTA